MAAHGHSDVGPIAELLRTSELVTREMNRTLTSCMTRRRSLTSRGLVLALLRAGVVVLGALIPRAGITAFHKLARLNVAEEDPPRWAEVLLYTHPSLAHRIAALKAAEKAPRGSRP